MSAAEFAAARELSPRTLQWWSSELKRRDRLEAASQTELRFVELKLREPPVAPTASVPAQLASSPPVSGIEVVLSGQRVVRVSPGFDAVTLQRVVVSLEARPC